MRLLGLILLILGALVGGASAQNVIGSGITGDLSTGAIATIATPVMFTGRAASQPSTTVVNYATILGGGGIGGYNATLTNSDAPTGAGGTFSNLYVDFGANLSAGGYLVCLVVNGACSALNCTVVHATSNNCVDNTHTVTVSPGVGAGNLVAWEFCPTGNALADCNTATAPTIGNPTGIQVSAKFTSTAANEQPLWGGESQNGTISATVTDFMSIGHFIPPNATENLVSDVFPAAGVIDQMQCWLNGAPGTASSGKSYAFTVIQNGNTGSPTSLACTITDTATTAQDLNAGHAVTVAALDTISIQSVPTGTPSVRQARFSFRWKPTVAGTGVLMNAATTMPAPTANTFGCLACTGIWATTEASEYALTPTLGSGMTLGNLVVAASTATGGGKTWTQTLFSSGSNGALGTPLTTAVTCQIANGTVITIGTGSTTGCQDATHTISALSGYLLDYHSVESSTPATVTWWKESMTVTIP